MKLVLIKYKCTRIQKNKNDDLQNNKNDDLQNMLDSTEKLVLYQEAIERDK